MYTKEEEEYLLEAYDETAESVELIANQLNRSPRSIISKLSRMGVYKKKEYTTKTGEKPITKLELVSQIASTLRCKPEKLEGLDKTPKQVLKYVLEKLNDTE